MYETNNCLKIYNTKSLFNLIIIVPVVKGTWAEDADSSISYYSDSEDPSLSTIDIGIPNTERGQPFC